jgi:predicted transcriptional regulator YdeE
MSLSEPRFETGRARLMGGLRRHHGFALAGDTIPAQWREFVAGGRPPGQVGDAEYGIVCGVDHAGQSFEYMCAVEVEGFDALPEGTGRLRLPEAYYAVFTYSGPVSGLKGAWGYLFNEWLPASGRKAAQSPDFEVYDSRFDPQTRSGEVELWLPIVDEG